MKLALSGTLAGWKADSTRRIEEHFNRLALANLHLDMVQIASRDAQPTILQRDGARRALLARVATATAVTEIQEIVKELELPDVLR